MNKIWWLKVPNALRLINAFIDFLEMGNNIVFMYPNNIPWVDSFRDQVQILQRQNMPNYGIDFIVDNEKEEPGLQIINKYCKKEIRDDYRPAIGYAKFLAGLDSSTLNDSIVWIKTMSDERLNIWCDFVSKYSNELKSKTSGGLFIIESFDYYDIKIPKGVKQISYSDYINQFDCYIFNVLASSILNISKDEKEYLSEVATSIFENDIELSSLCLDSKNYRSFLINPQDTIKKIIDNEKRSDNQELNLDLDETSFRKKLWQAQIKYLFPKIETYRESFISKYNDQIQRELPISNTSGEKYENTIDVEIGTLYYLACNGIMKTDKGEFDALRKFKEARNRLAHLDVLTYTEVQELIHQCSAI